MIVGSGVFQMGEGGFLSGMKQNHENCSEWEGGENRVHLVVPLSSQPAGKEQIHCTGQDESNWSTHHKEIRGALGDEGGGYVGPRVALGWMVLVSKDRVTEQLP